MSNDYSPRRFVAIDGESYTTEDDHRYVLLAASTSDYVYKADGIATAACFNFLLNLKRENPKGIYVAFGLNYDVNMMLRDVAKDDLIRLWDDHNLTWAGYKLQWIPGKWFSVSREKESVRIYDVFGFFQCSFVNALKRWDIPIADDLEDMKATRGAFTDAMRQRMIDYCIGECTALCELMDALRDALASVGLQPSSWVGAGAIASALLKREGVKDYHRHDYEYPDPAALAIMHSYFGGRVELFQQGHFERLTDYDVVSAYPSEARHLPSLVGGIWKQGIELAPQFPNSIHYVRWELPHDCILCPFPYRKKGAISYPRNGAGWYHYPEVKAATDAYPGMVQIEDSWTYVPLGNDQPFAFIERMFQYRKELKAKSHPGEKVLKLGLNAIYGKLAQGVGFQGKEPPFQSYYWAGRITSSTRARLFELGMKAPNELVMIATDGIFFTDPAPVFVTGKALGDLEQSVFSDIFVAQPGVYAGTTENGEYVARSRGFFAKEIDFDVIRKGYEDVGPTYVGEYESRRFVGLGSALARNDFAVWRTWAESERKLSLYPNRKFVSGSGKPTRHSPASVNPDEHSDIYVPKDGELKWTSELVELLEGPEQPMREF